MSSRGLQRRGRGPQAQGEEPHLLFLSYTQSRMTHAYRRRRPLPSRPEPRGHLVASCSLWTLWACCYLFNSCKLNCLQCFKTYFLFLRLKCPGNRMCFFSCGDNQNTITLYWKKKSVYIFLPYPCSCYRKPVDRTGCPWNSA